MNPTIDDHLDHIEVPATLGLNSWAWVLSMLPEDDLVTKRLRGQIQRHPAVSSCRVLAELAKSGNHRAC